MILDLKITLTVRIAILLCQSIFCLLLHNSASFCANLPVMTYELIGRSEEAFRGISFFAHSGTHLSKIYIDLMGFDPGTHRHKFLGNHDTFY